MTPRLEIVWRHPHPHPSRQLFWQLVPRPWEGQKLYQYAGEVGMVIFLLVAEGKCDPRSISPSVSD